MRAGRRSAVGSPSRWSIGLVLAIVALCCSRAMIGAAEGASAISFSPTPVFTYQRYGVRLYPALDLDDDGRLDLAAVHSEGLVLIYGRGDGTFDPPVEMPLGGGLAQGVAADVNGDGKRDLVICHNALGRILVLLCRGRRDYAPAVNYAVGSEPVGIVAVDLNRDGAVDLAISNQRSPALAIMLNRGDGTFKNISGDGGGTAYSAGIVSADFNGDGWADLAQSFLVSGRVSIYLNRGGTSFDGPVYATGGGYPNGIAVGDYNQDGLLDLAVANVWGHSASILFGDGWGSFQPPILYAAGSYPHAIGAADLDGDGDLDLVTANGLADRFTVLENHERGNFLAPLQFPAGGSDDHTLAIGDFNGDGRPDVAVENGSNLTVALFLNTTTRSDAPFAIAELKIEPDRLVGGAQVEGKVSFTKPVGPGPLALAVTSSDPAAVTVPATIAVAPGTTEFSFPITTRSVLSPTTVTVTVSGSGATGKATIQVLPGSQASGNLLVNGSFELPVVGVGWFRLNAGDNLPGWRITAGDIDVKRGYWNAVHGEQSIDMMGDHSATIEQTFATVPGQEYLFSGWVAHNVDNPSQEGLGTVLLNGQFFVQLVHRDPQASRGDMHWTPFSYRFRATGPTTTLSLIDETPLKWAGGLALDGLAVTAEAPLSLLSLQVRPDRVFGGQSALGTVGLSAPAPASGWEVALSSDGAAVASAPATVTVPAGETAVTFDIKTSSVARETPVTIEARSPAGSATAVLHVKPAPRIQLSIDPNPVVGGKTASGEVTLSDPAGSEGLLLGLASSDPSRAAVPTTVTVAPGATMATFPVATTETTVAAPVVITAAGAGATGVATLGVLPPPLTDRFTLISLTLDPERVIGGVSITGTVVITARAPAGGIRVLLAASGGGVQVPESVLVPEGQGSATFTVVTHAVDTPTSAEIRAIFGETRHATLSLLPPPAAAPESAAVALPAPNGYGWNNTDVTVTIRAAGDVKEIQYVVTGGQTRAATVPGNTASVTVATEGITAVTYFARGVSGQVEAPKTITVQIDKTPPTVSYGSHPLTYSIEQGVHITCAASDRLSGIAADTCADINGLAWQFSREGLNVFTAAAVDKAGNLTSAASYFSVRATVDGLKALTQEVAPDRKLARELSSCLSSVRTTKPGSKARARAVSNYVKKVQKYRGRKLPPDQADLLIAMAKAL